MKSVYHWLAILLLAFTLHTFVPLFPHYPFASAPARTRLRKSELKSAIRSNFVHLTLREEDPLKAVEALSEENIVPYKIPLADLPPVFPEKILTEETVIEEREITIVQKVYEEEAKPEVEPLPEKPQDANSEIVPNQNLTDDEIAQLILEEEELLNDKGVLGVNFKKLRPRATVLKQSKVIEELRNIATAEPPLVEQLKRTSVFLQKPERPVPVPRKKQEEPEETEVESYKVVIKKQQKRSITDRLLEKGLLKPEDATKTPEPPTPEVNMESNELGMNIEEDDSSILSFKQFDDNSSSEPTVTCFEFSSLCVEPEIEICSIPSSSLNLESENRANSELDIVPVQLSKRKEKETVASPRRQPNKHKLKRFYTRGHYFRRCLFGKRGHGEVKKSVKPKSSFEECFQDACDNVKPSTFQERRRRSSLETSRIKGRYLETYLKREDNWMRRMVDGLFDQANFDNFLSNKLFGKVISSKRISSRRTRYAEKILLRSVEFVAIRLRSDIQRYLEQGGSMNVISSLTSRSRIGKRLYFKGRYFQRIFWRNFARIVNYLKGVTSYKEPRGPDRRRSSVMIKMKGHYLERYLENTLFDLDEFRDRYPTRSSSFVASKRKLFVRTRYFERVLRKHFESLGLIVKYIYQSISDSSVVIPGCAPLNTCQKQFVTSVENDAALSNLIRSSKDFISTEVFHRGSRRLSRSCRGSSGSLNVSNVAKNGLFGINWFNRESTELTTGDKKGVQDNDRDRRRLSFVPTILYEGLTNHIGVDFTRLVAYAFVPCTSIILLYMYK
ncbi:uncharacterized protein LOC114871583 isoform X2 [Osmia bicornis bicornis]|uniref:uncharacterized protein LOC114871583 isoform X2 n=1 Tax=Osmia bicornis bicornis TaxID=1437191 RepID=UPI0010F67F88|nr:uncharacterized protein LOC114871583 isoform X2 [Osmia bicornis bicornis]